MLWPNPVRQPDLVAIRQWLPPKFSGVSVIEVACGTGYWTQLISSFAVNVLAIDAATETLAIAEPRIPNENFSRLYQFYQVALLNLWLGLLSTIYHWQSIEKFK